MLRATACHRVKYQPYAQAIQLRFKWRHRVDEQWRRLMDASCFSVDWQTRPRFPSISQFGGNWSHVVTCAHVVCPWDYPNFYPAVGATRFVSKITATDCETQIRQPSLQGEIVFKTFASKFNTYVHRNPRLDLAVVHVEQAQKRTQEVKMLWMQNEGFYVRPRFEVLEELKEGDAVWIYGCTARGDMFDEESRLEPLMVPTGVGGRVRLVMDEHFFVDTSEDELAGNVQMGMCGAAVMRNGKLVGMLTSTVAATNEDQKVANCAMCTHARDIRAFLIEVEKQMKNPPPATDATSKTVFQMRREAEGTAPPPAKDWDADDMRLARHVKSPLSLWRFEEQWTCEEDQVSSMMFGGQSGIFGKEAQEEVFGKSMNESRDDGKAPEGQSLHNADGSKPHHTSNRPDSSPANVYIKDRFVTHEQWDSPTSEHVKDFYRGAMGSAETDQMDKLRRSVDAINQQRAREDLNQTALNMEAQRTKSRTAAQQPATESGNSEAEAQLFGQYPFTSSGAAPGAPAAAADSESGSGGRDEDAAPRRPAAGRGDAGRGRQPSEKPSGTPVDPSGAPRRRPGAEDDDLDNIWGKH